MVHLANFIKNSLVDSYHFRLIARYPTLFMASEGKKNAARRLSAAGKAAKSDSDQPDSESEIDEPAP
jgi:hypothetical protein